MAAIYVIDASAAIKAFVQEYGSEQARALFASQTILLAPAHALGECAEILVRKVASAELSIAQAKEALDNLQQSIGYLALDELAQAAVDMAIETGASVYDTLYIVAAESLGCSLVTADERLIRKTSAKVGGGRVVRLTEVPV